MQPCQASLPSAFNLVLGPWGPCNSSCSYGSRTRAATCVSKEGFIGSLASCGTALEGVLLRDSAWRVVPGLQQTLAKQCKRRWECGCVADAWLCASRPMLLHGLSCRAGAAAVAAVPAAALPRVCVGLHGLGLQQHGRLRRRHRQPQRHMRHGGNPAASERQPV
jgi:hypothetical protein